MDQKLEIKHETSLKDFLDINDDIFTPELIVELVTELDRRTPILDIRKKLAAHFLQVLCQFPEVDLRDVIPQDRQLLIVPELREMGVFEVQYLDRIKRAWTSYGDFGVFQNAKQFLKDLQKASPKAQYRLLVGFEIADREQFQGEDNVPKM